MSSFSAVAAAEQLHRARLANAIASGELEGVEYTPAMRELQERESRGEVDDAESQREALVIARLGE